MWSYVRKKVFSLLDWISQQREMPFHCGVCFFCYHNISFGKDREVLPRWQITTIECILKNIRYSIHFKNKTFFFFVRILHINKPYAYINWFKLHFIYQSFETEREEMRWDKLLCESSVTVSPVLKQNMQLILYCVPIFLKSEMQMLFIVLKPDFSSLKFTMEMCGLVLIFAVTGKSF